MEEVPRLTVGQAAVRLEVKTETVYAYISRGLISSRRTGFGSTLDALEVEAFARRRRRSQRRSLPLEDGTAISSQGAPLMVLDTDIAHIVDGDLFFRGIPAHDLANDYSFETVARWLWGGPLDAATRFQSSEDEIAAAAKTVRALPKNSSPLDQVSVAVVALGAKDPLRYAPREDHSSVAARLIAGVAGALAASHEPESATWRAATPVHSIAESLLNTFTASSTGRSSSTRPLNAALVLLIDHDLAVSTLAARAAASARSTLYGAVSSALGAFDSRLHGNASMETADMIRRTIDGNSPEKALGESVAKTGRMVPGFGHAQYPQGDPRARALLAVLGAEAPDAEVLKATSALATVMDKRTGLQPNIDLALATLTVHEGMKSEAGPAIFAIARTAGWVAHAIDEYRHAPLRLRPHGRYTGPQSQGPDTPKPEQT